MSEKDYDAGFESYSKFACIGTGFSAIGLGATLKRWYGITDVRFFERHDNLGGTWHINRYPGTKVARPDSSEYASLLQS